MLNYETLLSSYDDKLTLMQWLKKVEEALKGASAVSFKVNKRGDATLTFSVVFEDGSELETSPIILQQGESVQGAAIRNGHLILTLTNGDELDAGDLGVVSGFSINEAQHLIVAYQNGTTQDLGAIFTGDVTITGNLAAAAVKTASLTSDEGEISAQKPVVEVMNGYSFAPIEKEGITKEVLYAGAVKNGNKLTFVLSMNVVKTKTISGTQFDLGRFYHPVALDPKLIPSVIGNYEYLSVGKTQLYLQAWQATDIIYYIQKETGAIRFVLDSGFYNDDMFPIGNKYFVRLEITFLLSENLAA